MIDVSTLSITDLNALRTKIDQEIAQRRNFEKVRLREEMAKKAAELGLTLEELVGSGKRTQTRSAGIAKYADKQDPSKTWTGRGRKPQWVLDFLAQGGNLADLVIV